MLRGSEHIPSPKIAQWSTAMALIYSPMFILHVVFVRDMQNHGNPSLSDESKADITVTITAVSGQLLHLCIDTLPRHWSRKWEGAVINVSRYSFFRYGGGKVSDPQWTPKWPAANNDFINKLSSRDSFSVSTARCPLPLAKAQMYNWIYFQFTSNGRLS